MSGRVDPAEVFSKTADPNFGNNIDGVGFGSIERSGIQVQSGGDGTLDLNWEGDGQLQTTTNVNPPTIIWYDVPDAGINSYTVHTTNGQAFYRIEWNPPPPRPLPWLTLHQNDLKLDGNVTSNSAWGTADVTFMGSTNPFYLNVRIGTNWPVQNLPIISVLGEDKPQTLSVNFKLTETGTEVTNVESGFSLTTNIIFTPPPTTEYTFVWRREVEIYSGIQGTSLLYRDPTDLVGGPVQSWRAGKPVFPNEEQGRNECTPAAVANSLNYLNTVFALGIDPEELTVERMKVATGWTPDGPVSAADPSGGWVTEKIVYMSLHNLPIVTERTTDPSRVMMALEQCCDVEIEMAGHVAAIVAMADVGNGKYALTLSHDLDQALPGLPLGNGGTRLEPILFDSNAGLLYGTFWSSRFITFVIECPADR
jgi:hypothetical protein